MRDPAKLYWFKGTTDEDGKILSLEPALRQEEDGGLVFFVEARDLAGAEKKVMNRYHRRIQKARHARLKREGRCRCGKKNDSGTGSRCIACKERDSIYAKRQRAKGRGEEVEKLDRTASLAERRKKDFEAVELETLQKLDYIWSTRGTIGLRKYLRDELARLRQRQVA